MGLQGHHQSVAVRRDIVCRRRGLGTAGAHPVELDATAVAPSYKLLSELVRDYATWTALTEPRVAVGLSFVVYDVIETSYGGKYIASACSSSALLSILHLFTNPPLPPFPPYHVPVLIAMHAFRLAPGPGCVP